MSSMMRNVRWVSLSQASKVLSQMVSVVVLSRMLPPSAYGVMAMAGVVTTFLGTLRDMGTGAAIIQRKTLTQAFANTVFWLNVGMGCALGLLLCIGSVPISEFFREPELVNVLIVLALMFPIGSATAVHQAMMERESRFKELAMLDVSTQMVGLALAVLAAALGAGVFSFVLPAVFTSCMTTVWLWFKSGWRPTRQWDVTEFKSLWAFSGSLSGFNLINYFARNADSMVIGRMLGSVALGQYGMAYKLMLFPVQNMSWVINRVLLPRLSQLQEDDVAARRLYFRVLGSIATVSAPLMLGLWALREPFITTLLGNKWPIVPSLLCWLAPVGLIQSFLSTSGSVLTATGQTGFLLRLGLFNTVTVILGFLVGSHYGVVQVAAGYFAANVVNAAVTYWVIAKVLRARFQELWQEIKAPMLAAMGMASVMWSIGDAPGVAAMPALIRLAVGSLVGASVYFGLMVWVFKKSPRSAWNLMRARA